LDYPSIVGGPLHDPLAQPRDSLSNRYAIEHQPGRGVTATVPARPRDSLHDMSRRLTPRLFSARPLGPALAAGLTLLGAPDAHPAPPPVTALSHWQGHPAATDPCIVRADSAGPPTADTVRIALTEGVDAGHAPVPSNDAERLVFRELYQTLVRVDCQGQLLPSLAAGWVSSDSGRVWTFTIRDSLRTSDGRPFSAQDVLSGWTARWTAPVPPGASIRTLEAPDEHTLRATLLEPVPEPRLFAGTVFAVTRRSQAPDSGWPIGTGPYRPDSARAAGRLRLVPITQPDAEPWQPVLEFWLSPGSDPRDLLDRGADLLVTTDPVLLDYAASRGDRSSVPLPWSRIYALLTRQPPESLPPTFAAASDSARAPEFREALARDAVRAESRAAVPPFWWEAQACGEEPGSPAGSQPPLRPGERGRIVYLRSDLTARDLAERIVALASRRSRSVAAGLGAEAFKMALRRGGDLGYVVALPRFEPTPCRALGAWPPGTLVLPLVETRARAVLRRGSVPWIVEEDGTLRVPVEEVFAP